jgi:hypothetical protein
MALLGREWSALHPGRFNPGERAPGIHWIEGWVSPRAGLGNVEKRKFLTLPGLDSDPSVVQPIASRYPDYAIPVLLLLKYLEKSDIYGKCVSFFSTDFVVNTFIWGKYALSSYVLHARRNAYRPFSVQNCCPI